MAEASPISPKPSLKSARVGPYLLGRTLGVGATGRVKAATHIGNLQKVAIKIITKNTEQEKEAKKLEREITIMKLIRHPNILNIYDIYESHTELFLVLEQVEGGELFDYLVKRRRLSEEEALHFFQQIVRGVEHCHRFLICHRDLKPENLLLDNNMNVKIADFGMANLQVPTKLLETSCGSPHYASPEVISGEKYDGPTADVWSCGVILFALLTGDLPFNGENIRKLLLKVKTGVYSIPSHVSDKPRDLITKMMQLEPSDRITLNEVTKHPWFCSIPSTNIPETTDSPDDFQDFEDGYPPDYAFEQDLIEALELLGWTNSSELKDNLTGKGKNSAKIFYQLLKKRKDEMLENYCSDTKYENEGLAIRRTESFGSDFTEKVTSPVPVEVESPTNANAPHVNGPALAPLPISFGAPKRQPSQVHTNSPLGGTHSEGKKVGSPVTGSIRSKKSQKGELAINTTDFWSKDEKNSVLDRVSTPKLRKGYFVSDNNSPIVPPTLKVLWFKGMFNFQPDALHFNSDLDMTETNKIILEILKNLAVDTEKVCEGSFKCKHDSASKTIKFRVEIAKENNGKLKIQLQLKQGSNSVFQVIAKKLQEMWDQYC